METPHDEAGLPRFGNPKCQIVRFASMDSLDAEGNRIHTIRPGYRLIRPTHDPVFAEPRGAARRQVVDAVSISATAVT